MSDRWIDHERRLQIVERRLGIGNRPQPWAFLGVILAAAWIITGPALALWLWPCVSATTMILIVVIGSIAFAGCGSMLDEWRQG